LLEKKPPELPLAFLPAGRCAVVKEVVGGFGFRRRLAEMGLVKGAVVRVIRNDRGPLIIALGESRLALGFGMAQKVIVQELG